MNIKNGVTLKGPRANLEAWRAALARIEFKFPIPVTMTIEDSGFWGDRLRMSIQAPDRDDGHEITVNGEGYLPVYGHDSPEAKIRFIYDLAKSLIMHEFDEHFRVDGKLLNDPHAPREDRFVIP